MKLFNNLEKFISFLIKTASLVITVPATWTLASRNFTDATNPLLHTIMCVAAVVLVEGIFILNWINLDQNKKSDFGVKIRNLIFTMIMYFLLLIVGFIVEGASGIIFRIALFLGILASSWDMVVLYVSQRNSLEDKDISLSPQVRRVKRDLEKKARILALRENYEVEVKKITEAKRLQLLGISYGAEEKEAELNYLHQENMRKLGGNGVYRNPKNLPNFAGRENSNSLKNPSSGLLVSPRDLLEEVENEPLEITAQKFGLSQEDYLAFLLNASKDGKKRAR